jgi:ATP-dependent Clp protease ATP-binding subunit ClpA
MPILFTRRCECVLEMSLRIALDLGHEYVGVEHLICAALKDFESRPNGRMLTCGIDSAGLQESLKQMWPRSIRELTEIPFCPRACNCIANSLRTAYGLRGYRVNCKALLQCVLDDAITETGKAIEASVLGAGVLTMAQLEALSQDIGELFYEPEEGEQTPGKNKGNILL